MMSENYSHNDAQYILDAYKSLLPEINTAILNYLDFGTQRQREWSCLTTNFHNISLNTIERFDKAVRMVDISKLPKKQLGLHFRQLSCDFNVGYSLGICPWTDYLLYKSFKAGLKRVVIILGHDWYPIIFKNLKVWDTINPPLQQCPVSGKYDIAIPDFLKNGDFILFFMNLYPDFREPFADTTGTLGDTQFYKPFVEGFEAICDSISQRYEIAAILLWGSDVWNALKGKTSNEWSTKGFINVIRQQHEEVKDGIPIDLATKTYKSFPLPHPAYFHLHYPKTFRDIYGHEFIQGIDHFIKNIVSKK